MSLAEGIRKHGFKKWYERELLQSHAHMVLAFLAVVGLFAAFEAASQFKGLADQAFNLGAGLLCAAIGLWGLRRYLRLLSKAEAAAHQADCPHCGTYGRLELVRADASGDEVEVRCRKCGHGWHMSA
ncbi:MAG: zinc-ribbon domain-containing protein [Rubrivivax sp.]|nr:zinc-ribbon domain-containing protein [Rubrivivax sp.]